MNKPVNTFRNYYYSLPANKLEDFRTQVCNICGFSIATFYHRLRESDNLFSTAEKTAIANYAGVTAYTIFGEETLKTA